MDQFTRPFPVVAPGRLDSCGAVTAIEPAETLAMQDRLHSRRSDAELVTDVGSTPPVSATQGDDSPLHSWAGLVRRAMRSAGAIRQPVDSFDEEPVAPFADRLGVDLEPFRGRFDRPALRDDAGDHAGRPVGVSAAFGCWLLAWHVSPPVGK